MCHLSPHDNQPHEVPTIIIPNLQKRKVRLREVRCLPTVTRSKCQCQKLNPGLSDSTLNHRIILSWVGEGGSVLMTKLHSM